MSVFGEKARSVSRALVTTLRTVRRGLRRLEFGGSAVRGGPIRDGRDGIRGSYQGDELERVEGIALSNSNLRRSK